MEVMRFGGELHCILNQILLADSQLAPVYLSKVDLVDTYMRLLVRIEDLPYVAFLISINTPSDQHLLGFHFPISMGGV